MPDSMGEEGARREIGAHGSPSGGEGDLGGLVFARGLTRALELIVTGAPLEDVLEFLIRMVEAQAPGMRGSVLLLEDGRHVRHGAAPSLPAELRGLIDGLAIGTLAGSCGTAMCEDRQVIVSDIATDPRWEEYREAALPFGLRACCSTPLHSSTGRVVGSFAMYYDEPRTPTSRELWLADVASHLSGIAVEHASAAAQLRRRAAEQAAVAAVGQRALLGGDDQGLMQHLVSTVSRTFDDARVALFEHGEDEMLLLRAAAGWPPGAGATPDDGVSFEVSGPAKAWGMLCVAPASAAACSDEETVFLKSIVNILATAIDRSRREEQVRNQALHDPLTGLPNRALMMSLLAHALDRERRVGRMMAVLFLDLDNFKLINDSLGHAAGDELLASLAPRLRAVVRQSDTVARFGGDEFVVVAEDIEDELEAVELAERITRELARPFVLRDGSHTITASIGVAVTPSGSGALDGLLRDADAAMYRAKEHGGGHRLYDAGMRDRAVVRTRPVGALREAVERQEFGLDMRKVKADGRTARRPASPRGFRIGAPPWPPRRAFGAAAVALTAVLIFGLVELTAGGSSSRAIEATVAWRPGSAVLRVGSGRAELVVRRMPHPPAGRIYEVWLARGAQAPSPTSALFDVNSSGSATVAVPGDLHGVNRVMVTAEPSGGSAVPTRQPVIVARLS